MTPSVTLDIQPGLPPSGMILNTTDVSEWIEHLAETRGTTGVVDKGAYGANAATGLERVMRHPCHNNAFIAAAVEAFAKHRGLVLRPQDVFLVILHAVSLHMRTADVQSKWTKHTGSKTLIVKRDGFVRGRKNDWQGCITGASDSFDVQMAQHFLDGVLLEVECGAQLSGATAVDRAAHQAAVMDACRDFFNYRVTTKCGFRQVRMTGTQEDWINMRHTVASLLRNRCTEEFADRWAPALLPLLDKFVREFSKGDGGQGDVLFWNSMVKRGGGRGSGARTWFNGWVNVLFPDLKDATPNPFAVPYAETNDYVTEQPAEDTGRDAPGPDRTNFPAGVSSVPVIWEYGDQEFGLRLKSGFFAVEVDWKDDFVAPIVGWLVAYAREQSSDDDSDDSSE